MSSSVKDAAPAGPSTPIHAYLAASSWVSVAGDSLASLRTQVTAEFAETLTVGTIKQADEQSLISLLAVHKARQDAGLSAEDCQSWALIAAPRTTGRKRMAEAIGKFRDVGAWSVSPHLIPNLSLHSVPGILSQALRLHGPNMGAGGMPGSEAEAFLAGLPLLQECNRAGVWIVFSGWDRETLDDNRACCQAAALGLQAVATHPAQPRLTFVPSGSSGRAVKFTLESLIASLRARSFACWDLDGADCTLSFAQVEVEAAA